MDNSFDLGDSLYGGASAATSPPSPDFDLGDHLYGNPDFSQRVSNDWDARKSQAWNTLADTLSGKKSGLEGGYEIPMDLVGGSAMDLVTNVGKSAINATPDYIKAPVKAAGEYLAQTPPGMAVQEGLTELGEKAAKSNPSQGTKNLLDLTGSAMNAMGGASFIENGINAAKNIPQIFTKDNLRDFAQSQNGSIFSQAPKLDPLAVQKGLNDSYAQALASKKEFYDYMNQTASGKTIDTSDMVRPAQKIVTDISSDPFHPGRPALGRMTQFLEDASANPQMPLADAVEMKQDINSFFNPRKFNQGAKSPYFQIGNLLDSKIEQAGIENPAFKYAKTLADQNYVNNVAQPFTENKVLEQFWKPEDYYAQKSIDSGLANQLPDATRQRAMKMLDNIKDPVQLDAVTRPLPDDLATQVRQAKLQSLTSGKWMYRAKELGNAAGAPLESPKHIFNAIIGQSYSPDTKALIGAAKEASPTLDPSYQILLKQAKSNVAP